ncbi:hypothetical protein AALO_G00193540 [Alosa alosa]|uniref:EGF-like domain-containing protein n=1 Tax=Alosa alosa TaxID=278164 RepID=A0AAV6GAF7_9TELE|nr:pro-epidermal growth factor [Alosa alosa]KAG5270516.1 hypothetical protein AALO_G00193540 [Alosa alosa]
MPRTGRGMRLATGTATLLLLLGCAALTTAQQCWKGRAWARGNWSCIGPEPFLIFGYGNAIFRMDLDGLDQKRVVARAGTLVHLDFHLPSGMVYWANGRTGIISRAAMDGTKRQKLLVAEKGISGLAVDWIHNVLLWTNQETGTIHMASLDGKDERTLLRQLSLPSSIVTDPNERFIFWLSDGVTPSIQRTDANGETGTTVLKIPDRLETLSIDYSDRRLFWIQQGLENHRAIGSCDYNGNVINVFNQALQSKTLRMSVFLDYVYITESTSQNIIRLDKYTGGAPETVNSKHLLHPPGDIRVVHPLQQPVVENKVYPSPGCDEHAGSCVRVCSGHGHTGQCQCRDGFALSKHGNICEDVNECALWNHGCSLGCENVPGSYFCTCPHGYLLLPDLKTCHERTPCVENATLCEYDCVHTQKGDVCVCAEGSLLQPDGHSCSGCTAADRGGCSQVCVPLGAGRWECECAPGYKLQPDGRRCTATGPSPYLLFANLVDIQQLKTDGTESRKVVEEPGGTIIALDYDPVESKVYFSSMAQGQIERADLTGGAREVVVSSGVDSAEGLAVDWMNRKLYWTDRGGPSISRCGLNGQHREVLIDTDIYKPRGITVHPKAQKLFWTDLGGRPSVVASRLDGGGRVLIAREGLLTPSGLALDQHAERLYWCDLQRGAIESADLDGANRHTLTQTQVGHPFSLAVFEDSVWVSDWQGNQLLQLQKTWGAHTPQRLDANIVRPAGLVIIHPLAKPGADMCLHQNGGCTQLCDSRLGLAHCSCHSQYIQSADGKGCVPASESATRTDSGDGESSAQSQRKALNDEGFPLPLPNLPEPTLITEKMVSDQDDCFSLRCDMNAQCIPEEGNVACRCLPGFTGNGQLCVDIDECTVGLAECVSPLSECVNTAGGHFCRCSAGFSGDGHHCTDIDECRLELHGCHEHAECGNTVGKYTCICRTGYTGTGFTCTELKPPPSLLTTVSPVTVTTAGKKEFCPATHDSYCMYEGVCFYLPEMESYACNCVSGYMGERCQFSDLEWWEHQQAEQEKRRNVAIAACLVLLIALLATAAILTYYYGSRRLKRREHPSVDNMSESSTSEGSITETITAGTPRFYVVLEHGACVDGKIVHVVGCQRRPVCPSCSSDTGDSMVSDEAGVGVSPSEQRRFGTGCAPSPVDASRSGVTRSPLDNLILLDEPRPPSPCLL